MHPGFSLGFRWIVYGFFLLIISGCAAVVPVQPEPAPPPAPTATDAPPSPPRDYPSRETLPEKPSPRAQASLTFTEQGKALIEQNRPDAAIRVLERAINIHPRNGKNYYYLAEAWLLKGNVSQASEFNRLAELYLKDDRQWANQVMSQRQRISKY